MAKVEELTRQLEELRGRQNAAGTGNGGGGGGGVGGGGVGGGGSGHLSTPASAELEKLRRELMVSPLTLSPFFDPFARHPPTHPAKQPRLLLETHQVTPGLFVVIVASPTSICSKF